MFPKSLYNGFSIAFKPAENGWGGGLPKYASNFDRIFSKRPSPTADLSPSSTATVEAHEDTNTATTSTTNTKAATGGGMIELKVGTKAL